MKYDPKYEFPEDPWHLIGLLRPSKHCKGKQERIIAYDHFGYAKWKCDCGHESDWESL